MSTLIEQELSFTFPDEWDAEHFDAPGRPSIDHFQPVDFVVELPQRTLFIEVKDPSASKAPVSQRQAFVKKMQTKELTHTQLVPKARTSWETLIKAHSSPQGGLNLIHETAARDSASLPL